MLKPQCSLHPVLGQKKGPWLQSHDGHDVINMLFQLGSRVSPPNSQNVLLEWYHQNHLSLGIY